MGAAWATSESLVHADFPVADPAFLVEDTVTCVVQVRGKVRDRLEVPSDITEDALRELALASPKVQAAVPDGIRTVDRPRAQAGQRRPRLITASRHPGPRRTGSKPAKVKVPVRSGLHREMSRRAPATARLGSWTSGDAPPGWLPRLVGVGHEC